VSNNVIYGVDYMGTYAAGVNIVGDNQTVTHNTIYDSGSSSIGIDDHVSSQTVSGDNISYNDMSQYNEQITDKGAIDICCTDNLSGTAIDHNWVHDPDLPSGDTSTSSLEEGEPGIYLDNQTYNALVYDNVGWDVGASGAPGTVLMNANGGTSSGNDLFNNDAASGANQGPAVNLLTGTYSSTSVVNNVGNIVGSSPTTESNNLASSTNPLYNNPPPGGLDFSLQSSSPARSAGIVESPATNGYTDSSPDEGAYQYGATDWTAGSSLVAEPNTPENAIVASDYSARSSHEGPGIFSGGSMGLAVGNFDGGDWIEYDSVNFGSGRDSVTLNLSSDPSYAGQQFEIVLDSLSGSVIGTVTVSSTGSFDTFANQTASITATSGTHNVYLVGLGTGYGIMGLDSFTFTNVANQAIDAVNYSSQSGGINEYSGGSTGEFLGNIDGGKWFEYNAVDFGTGENSITLNLSSDPAYAGQQFAIRLDSLTGPEIGVVTVSSTGSFTTFANQSAAITPTSGIHNLYFLGLGTGYGIMGLDWFDFSNSGSGTGSGSVEINAGGSPTGSFAADEDYSGGSIFSTTNSIDTSAVGAPAPQAVYQTQRYGDFTYTVGGLTVGQTYLVRLDESEDYWTAAGDREFNVVANGTQVLTNYDIFAAAGGEFKAVVPEFYVTANSSGQIILQFETGAANLPTVDGIEILG
jgi:hypothetical protein